MSILDPKPVTQAGLDQATADKITGTGTATRTALNATYALKGEAGGGSVTFTTLTVAGQAITIPTTGVTALALTQDSTGSRTVTWPAGIRWDGGTVPTLATAAGATDVFTFIALTGGGWLGKRESSHAAPADTTAPSALTGLTAGTATSTTIPLSWTAATDNTAVTGYEYSTNGTTWTSTGSTGTTYTVTGLTASTSYTIQVRAFDAAGNKGTAASVTATTAAPSYAPGDVVTSDSFNRANVASLNTQATDIALGGSAITWAGTGTLGITTNAMAQTAATPAASTATLTLPQTTQNIKLEFTLGTKPAGANIDVVFYDGASVAAVIRLSPASVHEVFKAGYGGSTMAITGGVGVVSLQIVGTAMTAVLPANDGTSVTKTDTNTASFNYSKITFNSDVATGFSIDGLKVSIPA